jgi:hypothetical protein
MIKAILTLFIILSVGLLGAQSLDSVQLKTAIDELKKEYKVLCSDITYVKEFALSSNHPKLVLFIGTRTNNYLSIKETDYIRSILAKTCDRSETYLLSLLEQCYHKEIFDQIQNINIYKLEFSLLTESNLMTNLVTAYNLTSCYIENKQVQSVRGIVIGRTNCY